MTFEMRAMTKDDLPAVADIYRFHVQRDPPRQWMDAASRSMDDPGGPPLAWVAEDAAGRVIGYVAGEVRSWEFGSEPAGWITGVGVDADHRSSGLGRALLEAMLKAFRRRNVATVRTMVQRDDVPVLRFFRAAGFATGPYTEMELSLEGEP
ncbi:MAG: GNAT family N-acetyltransferase [Deltaproteobacteria bacterium]|nr:GNAT family N-acetyltransferase [Deltaproteobacteria bacterium]